MEFYKKVKVKEHLLYASEIAKLYGIYSYTSNKPASNFVSILLAEHIENTNFQDEQLYYHTASGYMVKAYSKDTYQSAMNRFFRKISQYGNINSDTKITYNIRNKNYYIRIK